MLSKRKEVRCRGISCGGPLFYLWHICFGGRRFGEQGQAQGEKTARAGLGGGLHRAAVLQGDGAYDKQTKSLAAVVRPAGKALLKQMGQILRRNAAAGVPHRDGGEGGIQGELQRDYAVGRRKGEGVVAEVFQGGLQPVLIAPDDQQLSGQAEVEMNTGQLHIRPVGLIERL